MSTVAHVRADDRYMKQVRQDIQGAPIEERHLDRVYSTCSPLYVSKLKKLYIGEGRAK